MIAFLLACSYADGALDTSATTDSSETGDTPAVPLAVGDLVVSEFMPDPLAVDGDFGEWFEVRSLVDHPVDLVGVTATDGDMDGFSVVGELVLPPLGYLVFGASADTALNGGAPVDYAYSIDALKLGNEDDLLALTLDAVVLDQVGYYAATFPLTEGASLTLSAAAMTPAANDAAAAWCVATSAFGAGDLGTPGAGNDPC